MSTAKSKTLPFHKSQEILVKILDLLRKDSYSSVQLASKLHLSERTVRRYLEKLKKDHQAPIVKNARGYRLIDPKYELKLMERSEVVLSRSELRALVSAEAVLKESLHAELISIYRHAIQKMESAIQTTEQPPFLNRRYSAAPIPQPVDKSMDQFFTPIAEAMENGQCLKITYNAPGRKTQDREIEPYHLRFVEGRWVLYAFCRLRQDIRVFSIPRISNVIILDEPHVHAADFPIGTILKNVHTIWRAQKRWEVELAVSPKVAPAFQLNQYFKSQKMSKLFKGERFGIKTTDWYKFSFLTYSLDEVTRWIARFGKYVLVLRPLPLVQHFAEETLIPSPINYPQLIEKIKENHQRHDELLNRFEANREAVIAEFQNMLRPKLASVISKILIETNPIRGRHRRFNPILDESPKRNLEIAETELVLLLTGEGKRQSIITLYDPDQLTELSFYILHTLYFRLGGTGKSISNSDSFEA